MYKYIHPRVCVLSLRWLIDVRVVLKKSWATPIAAGFAVCDCRVRSVSEKVRAGDDML